SSNEWIAMDVHQIIRLGTINRVKSEQAIRRSKRLVKGTKNLLGGPMHAPASLGNEAKDSFKTMEIVRQESRKVREHSRRAIEQSKAARNRQVALQDRLLSQRAA